MLVKSKFVSKRTLNQKPTNWLDFAHLWSIGRFSNDKDVYLGQDSLMAFKRLYFVFFVFSVVQ